MGDIKGKKGKDSGREKCRAVDGTQRSLPSNWMSPGVPAKLGNPEAVANRKRNSVLGLLSSKRPWNRPRCQLPGSSEHCPSAGRTEPAGLGAAQRGMRQGPPGECGQQPPWFPLQRLGLREPGDPPPSPASHLPDKETEVQRQELILCISQEKRCCCAKKPSPNSNVYKPQCSFRTYLTCLWPVLCGPTLRPPLLPAPRLPE